MRKRLFLLVFAILCSFYVFSDEEENYLEPDISPDQMDEIYTRYLSGTQAPDIQFLSTNGLIVPFSESIEISDGVFADYTVYSLTNFQHDSGIIRDITTSRKKQYRHDCTKFGTTSAMEIEITRQFFNIYNNTIDFVELNGGISENVEIDLSEAFEREINGCNDNAANTIDKTVTNGVIQEEHYPYNERKFLDKAYYSKRDTDRYGFSNGFSCRGDIAYTTNPVYNDTLLYQTVLNNLLMFYPVAGYSIREDSSHQLPPPSNPGDDVIERIKSYIMHGKPAVISYTMGAGGGVNPKYRADGTGQLISDVDHNNPWGKMIRPPSGGLKIFDNTIWSDHYGHVVAVIGYMVPDDPSNPEYLLIKDSHSGYHLNAFPVIGSNGTLLFNCLRSVDVFDSIVVERGNIPISEFDLEFLDTDGDGVPDLFDNSSFSGTYFGDNTLSQNPDQSAADGDDISFEFDLCPYVADEIYLNMDHDNKGDLCDYDIDGDGISNIDEGMGQDLLYKIIESTGIPMISGQYVALNPFLKKKADGSLVLWNKYFITSCFAYQSDHCDEPDPDFCSKGNKPEEKYITDLCFYDNSRLRSAPENSGKDNINGTFKFLGGAKHYGPANAGEELTADFPEPHKYYSKWNAFFVSDSEKGYYRRANCKTIFVKKYRMSTSEKLSHKVRIFC